MLSIMAVDEGVELAQNYDGARFINTSMLGATFRGVRFDGSRFIGVEMVDVEISGYLRNLRVNGVDVVALVEAELDRIDPERVLMRPENADGFRLAWQLIEQRWDETVARARRLPDEALHESVDEEWSFLQTLRHLSFATDIWVLLGEDGAGDRPQ